MSIRSRLDLFFVDSDFLPLQVHENYLSATNKDKVSKQEFHKIVEANEGFVLADLLDKNIRREQEYGLMPSYGFMSCIYTTEKACQSLGFPRFPSWLGKNSSERKNKRLVKELKYAISPMIVGSTKSVKYEYAPALFNQIIQLMKNNSVEPVLDIMELYHLNPTLLN